MRPAGWPARKARERQKNKTGRYQPLFVFLNKGKSAAPIGASRQSNYPLAYINFPGSILRVGLAQGALYEFRNLTRLPGKSASVSACRKSKRHSEKLEISLD
jgi:hypothetical protein